MMAVHRTSVNLTFHLEMDKYLWDVISDITGYPRVRFPCIPLNAFVAELADALVLGTSIARCESSNLSKGTKYIRGNVALRRGTSAHLC